MRAFNEFPIIVSLFPLFIFHLSLLFNFIHANRGSTRILISSRLCANKLICQTASYYTYLENVSLLYIQKFIVLGNEILSNEKKKILLYIKC